MTSPTPEQASATSPTIATAVENQMTFPDALTRVISGRKITKLEWGNRSVYVYLNNGFLTIRKETGTNHRLLVSDGDLMGEDWIMLPE